MWDEAAKLYPLLGATPNRSTLAWQFHVQDQRRAGRTNSTAAFA
jgi:hypothetical protein